MGPLHIGRKVGPLHTGRKVGPLHTGRKVGPHHIGKMVGPLHIGRKVGSLHTDKMVGPLHTGKMVGPLHTGKMVGPLHIGRKVGPLHTGKMVGPLHTGKMVGPLHIGRIVDPCNQENPLTGINVSSFPVILGGDLRGTEIHRRVVGNAVPVVGAVAERGEETRERGSERGRGRGEGAGAQEIDLRNTTAPACRVEMDNHQLNARGAIETSAASTALIAAGKRARESNKHTRNFRYHLSLPFLNKLNIPFQNTYHALSPYIYYMIYVYHHFLHTLFVLLHDSLIDDTVC